MPGTFLGGTEDDPVSGISPLALLLSGYGKQGQQDPAANPNNPNGAPASNAIAPAASTPVAPAVPQAAVGTVPTQPAAATTDALSKPLPQAPQMDPRYAALEATIAKDRQPTNPHDPNVKPRWYDRLLGGLVGFGTGYKEGPTAGIQAGGAVTNRRFNQAEGMRSARLAGEEGQAGDMERTYGLARQGFEDEMKGATEERQRANESSLATERSAKAAKYENAIDPSTIEQDEDGKWYGTSYGGDRKETGAPKGYKGDQSKPPTSYESGVYQEELARTPNDKAGALARANKRIEKTEIKKFQYKPDAGDNKPLTPGEKLRRSVEVNKLNAERKKSFDKLEDNKAADEKNTDEFLQKKQSIEDTFAAGVKDLGVNYDRLIFNKDGSFTRESQQGGAQPVAKGGNQAAPVASMMTRTTKPLPSIKGNGRQLDKQTASEYLRRAGGDKEKARSMAKSDGWKF